MQPSAVDQSRPQFLIYRRLGTMNYSAFNQFQTIDLDNLHGLRFVDMYLDGQVDGSGGTADGANLAGAPAHFLSSVQLKGNGKEPIFDETGYGLYLQNSFDYGVNPTLTMPAVSAFGSANAQFNGTFRLDLAQPWGKVPIDTALVTALFKTLQLKVQISDKTGLVNATNDRTVAFDTVFIDVYVGEIVNFRADLFGKVIAKHYFVEAQPAASSTAYEITLPTGNSYRSLLLEVVAPNANPTPVNTVMNNIQVKAANDILVDCKANIGRNIPALERGIAVQTGAYFLDFSRDGLLGENLDASRINNLKLSLDVTLVTGNRIRVHCVELIVL